MSINDCDSEDEEAREPADIPDDRIYFLKPGEGFRGIWAPEKINAIWQRIHAAIHSSPGLAPTAPVWYVNPDGDE